MLELCSHSPAAFNSCFKIGISFLPFPQAHGLLIPFLPIGKDQRCLWLEDV